MPQHDGGTSQTLPLPGCTNGIATLYWGITLQQSRRIYYRLADLQLSASYTNERTNLLLGPVVDGRPAADLVVLLDDGGRPPLGDQRTQPRLRVDTPLASLYPASK